VNLNTHLNYNFSPTSSRSRLCNTGHRNYSNLESTDETKKGIPKEIIFEITIENWDERVVNDSEKFPVIVECYCEGRTDEEESQFNEMSRTLSNLVRQQNAEICMGRLNVFENESLAKDLQIQHVPTLLMIYRNSIVNYIYGINDSNTLKTFVLSGSRVKYMEEVEKILKEAETHFKEGKILEAKKLYSDILYIEKYKSQALGLAGLASCSIKDGHVDEAQQAVEIIKNSYPEYLTHSFIKMIISQIELLQQNVSSVEASELLRKIEEDPKDLQARYDLAMQYIQKGQYKLGFDQLFESIKIDREWNGQAARALLIKTFSSMDENSDDMNRARKRLNNLWYK